MILKNMAFSFSFRLIYTLKVADAHEFDIEIISVFFELSITIFLFFPVVSFVRLFVRWSFEKQQNYDTKNMCPNAYDKFDVDRVALV